MGMGVQLPTGLHQYNTQHLQQNMVKQQVNQVDPEQLEQLLESLVKARVENNYHQMRQAAQQEICPPSKTTAVAARETDR